MAFGYVGARGSASSSTTGTSLQFTIALGEDVPVGALIIVRCVSDNTTTTQGVTADHSVSDSAGNSYTRIVEYTRTDGSAADGVTTSLHYSKLTSGLVANQTVVTFSHPSLDARAFAIHYFTSNTIAGTGGTGSTSTGTTPSTTISSLPQRTYLFVGLPGIEGKSNETYTEDSNYTTFITYIGQTAGAAASCASVKGGWRIKADSTGDTHAPTLGTSRDYAHVLGYLYETEVSNRVRMVISNA